MEKKNILTIQQVESQQSKVYTDLANLFTVLSHPIRLQIIELLADGPKCVCELTPRFAMSQPAISKHLKLLVDIKILQHRKDGTKNLYKIANSEIHNIIQQGFLALPSKK
ncbi:MAG: ArsR family transcriptional regulator [Promethearchaeota archaeon]|nr:MAG: ArsR family transcriptional regulator [Candidatus Lokiarchaeota archaeon]